MTRWYCPVTIIGCLMSLSVVAAASEWTSTAPVSTDAVAGFWLGVYGGGAVADPSGTYAISSASLAGAPSVIAGLDAAGSHAISTGGAVFGVQGGWTAKLHSNFVFGVEGDFGRYGLQGSRAISGIVPVFGIPFSINQSISANWQGSLRLRAGYAVTDLALVFVEAGPTLADVHYTSAFWDAASETEYKSIQAIKFGVSVGAGAEFALTRNVTVRAEYLFSRFPSATGNGASLLSDGTTAYIAHSSGAIDQSAFRVGLSYYLK